MRIFHDWEFLEDGHTIEWISVGMRREDGGELYLVNAEMPAYRIADHPWLMANVVPHLPRRLDGPGQWSLDTRLSYVVDTSTAAERIRKFILGNWRSEADVPELWAWYGSYDHVRLAQMWGPMISLPSGVPMVTHDIATLKLLVGKSAAIREPKQEGNEHHALADARHNEKLHAYYLQALFNGLDRNTD